MNIDEKINLYFFDPRRSSKEYKDYYKKVNPERYKKENGCRFSPLYFLFRDIRHCFLLGRGFNNTRKHLNEATFASVILIKIGIDEVAKKILIKPDVKLKEEKIKIFVKDYMEIKQSLSKPLYELRNAIEHSGYSLHTNVYKNIKGQKIKTKYYYSLGSYKWIVKEDKGFKFSYPAKMFLVNPYRLYGCFRRGMLKLELELRDKNNNHLRDNFLKNCSLKNWVIIK